MIKPFHTLATLLAVGALCLLAMLIFPKEGIAVGDGIVFTFPKVDDLFTADSSAVTLDVDSLLNSYAADSSAASDSLAAWKSAHGKHVTRLQFRKGAKNLPRFFAALEDLSAGRRGKVRILHYGDSQIEGDRITSYVREKLQQEFGGSGPGMLPLKDFIPNMSIVQNQSSNWLRYTVFGRRDTNMHSNRFGLRGVVCRFTPNVADSIVPYKPVANAWVEFIPSPVAFSKAKQYRLMRLHYGYNKAAVQLKIEVDGQVIETDSLPAGNGSRVYEYAFAATPQNLRLHFSGKDSPDFYAISLESFSGVVVDNIPMRGSSGTVFTQISGLAAQYSKEPISLIILQYGGNTVPHITSKQSAKEYGRWFAGQIAQLKKLVPEADIVLIGPSDMSTKDKTEYVTFPYLVEVRDALKEAALSQGVAFWDLFEVMGGKNSMPAWVAANPPLAGQDYVHFTPKGARKVAELFYNALRGDFIAQKEAEKATTQPTVVDTSSTQKAAAQ